MPPQVHLHHPRARPGSPRPHSRQRCRCPRCRTHPNHHHSLHHRVHRHPIVGRHSPRGRSPRRRRSPQSNSHAVCWTISHRFVPCSTWWLHHETCLCSLGPTKSTSPPQPCRRTAWGIDFGSAAFVLLRDLSASRGSSHSLCQTLELHVFQLHVVLLDGPPHRTARSALVASLSHRKTSQRHEASRYPRCSGT